MRQEVKVKSETTVRRYIKELQEVVDSDDLIASRIAYFGINAIRRVTEDVHDWTPLRRDAFETAALIYKEITDDQGKREVK